MHVNTRLKQLVHRFTYRLSFFYFLRKVQSKFSFAIFFLPLLFYKLFPQFLSNYTATLKIFGRKFIVRDLTDVLVIKETFHDQCYKSLFTDLRKPTTFIDLGSYIGDAAIYSQNFPKVKAVIAVEPDPRNIKILKKNFQLNKVKNITFIAAAISGKSGYSNFNMGIECIASSLQIPKKIKDKIKVSTISLSDILQMTKTSSIVLKSDCEGAEYDFLMQTSPRVLSKIDKIIFEYHMNAKKLKEVISHLKKAGFLTKYEDLILEPNVGMAYANKPSDNVD